MKVNQVNPCGNYTQKLEALTFDFNTLKAGVTYSPYWSIVTVVKYPFL